MLSRSIDQARAEGLHFMCPRRHRAAMPRHERQQLSHRVCPTPGVELRGEGLRPRPGDLGLRRGPARLPCGDHGGDGGDDDHGGLGGDDQRHDDRDSLSLPDNPEGPGGICGKDGAR